MEDYEGILKNMKSGEMNEEMMKLLILAIEKSHISSKESDDKEDTPSRSGMNELELKSSKFYKDKIDLSPSDLSIPRNIYKELGQFDYCGEKDADNLHEQIATIDGTKRYYIGQFKPGNKIRDGIGISVLSCGTIYEGYFKDDKPNGYGRFIFSAGDYYISDIKNGKQHGRGEQHWADGHVYKGQFENGVRHGLGEDHMADGDVYIGHYENGRKNGQGKYLFADGQIYNGGWENSTWNGQGTMTYPDGTKEIGQWKDGMFQG